jgi:LysM repeat protein
MGNKFIGLMTIGLLLLGVLPAMAQEPYDPEAVLDIVRVVGTPYAVVSLMPDGALHYYAIHPTTSEGILVGVTPPGWRNDTLSPRLIDQVSRGGLTAQLFNLGAGRYQAILYFNGGELDKGEFSGAGPVGSGVIVRANNQLATTIPFPNTAPPSNLSGTTTTATGSRRDNGASDRANGAFDGSYYIVARGDNLYRIALRFNTTFAALMRLNNISNANLIYAGQRLRIP